MVVLCPLGVDVNGGLVSDCLALFDVSAVGKHDVADRETLGPLRVDLEGSEFILELSTEDLVLIVESLEVESHALALIAAGSCPEESPVFQQQVGRAEAALNTLHLADGTLAVGDLDQLGHVRVVPVALAELTLIIKTPGENLSVGGLRHCVFVACRNLSYLLTEILEGLDHSEGLGVLVGTETKLAVLVAASRVDQARLSQTEQEALTNRDVADLLVNVKHLYGLRCESVSPTVSRPSHQFALFVQNVGLLALALDGLDWGLARQLSQFDHTLNLTRVSKPELAILVAAPNVDVSVVVQKYAVVVP